MKEKENQNTFLKLRPVFWIHFHQFLRLLVRPPAAKTMRQIESKYAFQEALDGAGDKPVSS